MLRVILLGETGALSSTIVVFDGNSSLRLNPPDTHSIEHGRLHTLFQTGFIYTHPIMFLCDGLPAGPGHVVHPVHRLHAARDPGEAAEEPEHGSQLKAALPPAGSAGSAQLLPALQAVGHRR